MKKQTTLSNISSSIIPSLHLLRKNDPLRLAGATAFFTTFALPFIVFILAQFFHLFLSPKIIGHGLIENIAGNIGQDGADQVRQVIHSIRSFNNHWYVILFGFLFLLFVATTLFIVIKNSINQIWTITVERSGLLYNLRSRLRSFAVILLIGILFFVNLFFKSIETIGGNYTEDILTGSSIYFKVIFNEVSSVIIVTTWFVILFRFLADGKPRWNAAIVGGLLTSILFIVGRVLLKVLLINSNIGKLYGSSGSFVLLLLFVFYSSFILYYGACFIAVYSEQKKWLIKND
ncbi:YihY/virulence factor BrkB family protein [Ferruginibacter albus]|uniref:YihY/virulence factor BrkB family protein n=1 Tax=Ferruginibacter albus TaxID=2875540 RepID=UPI001CC5D281|nr:YihY/virulence factor BrkB family protein [Ferruginibacter albus]UAY51248.1 YihY/virulence factor BrkB family protein [Ferruginibacter albus]